MKYKWAAILTALLLLALISVLRAVSVGDSSPSALSADSYEGAFIQTTERTAKPSPGIAATEKASLAPSPTLEPTPAPPAYVEMKVTGDLMCHSWQYNFAYDAASDSYDFNYAFDSVAEYLRDADITIGNLETTFAGKDMNYSDYPMFNTPVAYGEALKKAGYDFVTTANNHCNDRWETGILRTIEALDAIGLEHTGTFSSQEERDNIFIKEINGISFAFLSYTYGTNGLPLTEGKPWLANIMEEDLITSDIKKAKSLNPDFIIVFPHMGNEYESSTREVFKDWVKLMLRAGADIVLASHPHVLQPVEFYSIEQDDGTYRDGFVAYSLGNFVSSQRDVPRESGMILHLSFEKNEGEKATLKQVSYIPTWVKFVDKSGAYDIKVLSVYDAIKNYEYGADTDFRPSDITRLKQVHAQTTKMFLGTELPPEEIENEYVIEKTNMVEW